MSIILVRAQYLSFAIPIWSQSCFHPQTSVTVSTIHPGNVKAKVSFHIHVVIKANFAARAQR